MTVLVVVVAVVLLVVEFFPQAAKAAMASIRVILVVSTGDRLVFMHSFPFGEELNINGLIFTGDFTRTLGLWLWQQSYGHGTIAGV